MDKNFAVKIVNSRAMSVISGILFFFIYAHFAYEHLLSFRSTRNFSLLLFVFAETIAAGLFVFRSSPKSVTLSAFDWFVAVAGTFTPLFFTPTDSGVLPAARYAMYVGVCLLILALVSLNRSFALVPAIRSIKTDRMYQFVRHPIYLSYCITFTGYVCTQTSVYNLTVYVTAIFLLVLRIFKEEQHLSKDPSYRDYKTRVRYRLIPFVF